MLRRIVTLAVVVAAFGGCARVDRAAVLSSVPGGRQPANLALGPRAEMTQLASRFAGRSDWPATPSGYRFDEVTYFNRIGYDYQAGFDRHGGIYYGTETVTSGIWVR